MWTFDNPPTKLLQERYGFTPTQEWLDHVRLSSVRFNDGGSGSFISPNGLVMTNHHVAVGQLQKMSSAEKDYVALGFYAKTAAEEIKCPDLELNVLISMENVTDRVRGAVKPGMSEMEALEGTPGRIAPASKRRAWTRPDCGPTSSVCTTTASSGSTDTRSTPTSAWSWRPNDRRLTSAATPDNFTYPRYDLDMAFFRVYENDKPAKTENYLKWSAKGADDKRTRICLGTPRIDRSPATLTRNSSTSETTNTLSTLKYHQPSHSDPARVLEARRRTGTPRARSRFSALKTPRRQWAASTQDCSTPRSWPPARSRKSDFRRQIAGNPEWQKKYG